MKPSLARVIEWGRSRWGRRAAWGLLITALLLALLATAPPLLRGHAEAAASAAIGRAVHIGALSFNPLRMRLQATDLRIAGRAGEAQLLGIERVVVNIELSSVWRRAPVISHLRIEKPRLHLARIAANQYSVDDILQRLRDAPAKPAGGEPARFALFNLELVDGYLEFDDRPRNSVHKAERVQIGLPFLSSIPAHVEVEVQPSFSARLDGAEIRLGGEARPFAPTREADLEIKLAPVDLRQFLPYLPQRLELKLHGAQLASEIKLAFRHAEGKTPELLLSGTVDLLGLDVAEADGTPIAKLERLRVEAAELAPLAGRVKLTLLELRKPQLRVEFDAKRRIRAIEALAREIRRYRAEPVAAAPASTPTPASAAASAAAAAPAPGGMRWSLARVAVLDGSLDLGDPHVRPALALRLAPLQLTVLGLSDQLQRPAELQFSTRSDIGAELKLAGQLVPQPFKWDGVLEFKDLPPAHGGPYLFATLPKLVLDAGLISGRIPLHVAAGKEGLALKLEGADLSAAGLVMRLKDSRQAFLRLPELALQGIDLDLVTRRFGLASARLSGLQFSAVRGADGRIDLAALLPAPAKAPVKANTAPQRPWQYRVEHFELAQARVELADRSRKTPLALRLAELNARVDGLDSAGARARVQLSTQWNRKGRLALQGELVPQPFKARLKLDARELDITALAAQLTEQYDVFVSSGRLQVQGEANVDLGAEPLRASYRGELALHDFASFDTLNDADFVRWRRFALRRVEAQTQPLKLKIGEVALSDFATRLILDAQGRLNLREITRARAVLDARDAAAAKPAAPAVAAASAPTAPTAPTAWPPLRIDRIVLAGGNIDYSDRFVKPNFDANLRDMGGKIEGLGTTAADLATVNLAGSLDGSAPLTVTGSLAPFRNDRFLDLRVAVKGYELSGLSSYAGKYVGYGIEKGQLSMDLHYRINERQLSAENRVFLNQLTFGDAIDSPEATSLPVRFAVSLLQNSRGEIDINLPIAGTLDDPEFSMGGLIWTMIGNFFQKLVSAPFAFLGGGEAGGEDLARLEFAAGSAQPPADAGKRLDAIAETLLQRPALKLEITGTASPDELDALKRETLLRQLRASKLKRLAASGENESELATLALTADEYGKLLAEAYAEADFAKPKNALGLNKSLSVAEMEALLLRHSGVGESALLSLAQRRATSIKSALLAQGKLPAERLFVLAPQLGGEPGAAAGRGVAFSLR